ncbi:MAG: hypothetical protein Q9181_008373, partial [Wetmoreana brouardii]
MYRVSVGHDDNELAKVCLTYLNFQDFDNGGYASEEITNRRFEDYPLRQYAVLCWNEHAEDHLDDDGLFQLIKQLFNPSKPNTLISWAQDFISYWSDELVYRDQYKLDKVNSGIAEATALHYAAMLALPEVCAWLIDSGCDINRRTTFGTPLHCGLMSWQASFVPFYFSLDTDAWKPSSPQQSVINILLEAGADPNCYLVASTGKLSPLFLSLFRLDRTSAVRLLEKGGRLDESCLALLESRLDDPKDLLWDTEDTKIVLQHAKSGNVQTEHHSWLLRIALRAGTPATPNMIQGLGFEDEIDHLPRE